MRTVLALLMSLAAVTATAAPLPPAARAEVDALLTRLQASGCEFNRNGSWYAGAEAKAHLLKKLDYLEGKDMVQTAEQFIERGASTSSTSGKPYLVRCAGKAPVESAQWLKAELQQVRAARAASSAR
ncbi:hypothetical protein ASC95_09025 [Pelomonas sp. Root1217]|uniref:DUF5329 domain-containing protein n=1 Tax=Pelomonas sp. Root1217 TaxID=1736430 RepID=UPI0007105993|nr:DUF5329 domain-containing protein [Pelomonas sp. Root1217]KQV52922.1 hypothetical protein ASC95_09025 [Pelomonas sp. Root1217]